MTFEENLKSDIIYKYNDFKKLIEIKSETQLLKNNKGIGYYNIACSFDIETTSFLYNGEKAACMYIWQFGLNGVCFIGRTWTEFLIFQNYVEMIFSTNEKKRLIVYVHNLSYEFQFFRKWQTWIKIFALSERKPLTALTDGYIEYRCSYLLTNKSLKKVGEDLQKYRIKKMVGDLDYKKIRHSGTPLTIQEMGYCINDIKVVMAHIQEQIEKEKYIFNIPLTQTGYVRREVRNNCLKNGKYKNWGYVRLMKNLQINDLKEYKMLKRAFAGGFTHANAFNSNTLKEDVIAYDFCSSYPTMMIAYDYPMSRGEYIKIENMKHFRECLKYYCCVFTVRFFNIRGKNDMLHENYIQYAKTYMCKNYTINNGRIVNAEVLDITITNIDFWIIEQCYYYDYFQFSDFIIYQKAKLPKEIILSILTFYHKKTTLKGVEGMETEYLLSKGMLNSIYGMCVTDIVRDVVEYLYNTNQWVSEIDLEKKFTEQQMEEILQHENENRKRFLFYAWGVFVTAYARRALWSGILEFKDDYIYSDTDSIYVFNNGAHDAYINRYNDYIVKCCEYTLSLYNIDLSLIAPRTKDGIKKPLGVWEIDKRMKKFKTVGAKRYIYETVDGDINLTVSGVNKKIAVPYLLEKYGDKIFDEFKEGLEIPKGRTGKMIHTYIDNEIECELIDYMGKKYHIYEKSVIHLDDSEYKLSLSPDYIDYLLTF